MMIIALAMLRVAASSFGLSSNYGIVADNRSTWQERTAYAEL